MVCIVIYDIEADKPRRRIAEACKNYGLERVQWSAFWGELTRNRCEELLIRCEDLLGDEAGRIHVFPMCDSCFSGRMCHATEDYATQKQAPVDRSAAAVFVPDSKSDESSQGSHDDEAPSKGKASDPADTASSRIERARADVVRRTDRRPRDRPVGTDDDPWEDAE